MIDCMVNPADLFLGIEPVAAPEAAGGAGADPNAPSGHEAVGTFQFTTNRTAGATTGALTGWTEAPAANDYAFNPDTSEYIKIVFFNPGDGAVEMTRAQLKSTAAAISATTVWTLYRAV